MTKGEKNDDRVLRNYSAALSTFRIEGERCSRGICMRFSGTIGINEFSEELIELKNHGGRVTVKGKRLKAVIFENRQVEVNGRIEAVEFRYGKN